MIYPPPSIHHSLPLHVMAPPADPARPYADSLMFTTQRIQSPCFIASNAALISSNDLRCVMNSSTFSLPVK